MTPTLEKKFIANFWGVDLGMGRSCELHRAHVSRSKNDFNLEESAFGNGNCFLNFFQDLDHKIYSESEKSLEGCFSMNKKVVSTKSLQSRWTLMPSTIILFTFLRPLQINRHLLLSALILKLMADKWIRRVLRAIKLIAEPMNVIRRRLRSRTDRNRVENTCWRHLKSKVSAFYASCSCERLWSWKSAKYSTKSISSG